MKKCNLCLLFLLWICNAVAQSHQSNLLEDFDRLENLIKTKHPRPDWKKKWETIEGEIEGARQELKNCKTADQACFIPFFKAIASLQDGHSMINGSSRYKVFGYYPITFKWMNGELAVVKTSSSYEEILGSTLKAIDNVPISEILDTIKNVIPHANPSRFKKYIGNYLHLPGLLYGLGMTSSPTEAHFTFAKGSKSIARIIKELPPSEEANTSFISLVDRIEKPGLYQQNNDLFYWFDYDRNSKVFYFQYNRISNMQSESGSAFAQRMWKAFDSLEVDKFVLDLRYNGGGSFPYSLGFVQGILDRKNINQRGKLFVITGHDTFSAAIDMLNQLELRSQAIILGEYPCDHPSSPGDAETYTLPNSGIKINLSSLFHPTLFPNDKRTANGLDQRIITTWEDYKTGHDPILQAILDYPKENKNIASATSFQKYLGRYEYSQTRDLILKNIDGLLWLDISHGLRSPLYQEAENRFTSEVVGLNIELLKNEIRVHFPDNTSKSCKQLKETEISPIELLYLGRIEDAKEAFLTLYDRDKDNLEFNDDQMAFLASIIYFDLRNHPDLNARAIAKSILNLGILLNDGDAPFCKFSLRFY